jgi:hypothetical protein
MPTKTVTIPDSEVEVVEIYLISVHCPYCKYGNEIESKYNPPKDCKCFRCDKKFKIKIDENK